MIITSIYPSWAIIGNNKETQRVRYLEFVKSLRCTNPKRFNKCRLIVEITKKGTLTGKVYNKKYWTNEQLKDFYSDIFKKYYLKTAEIIDWIFIEKNPARVSEITIKVKEL